MLYGGIIPSIHAIGFVILYSTIALILIYKLAPKLRLFDRFILKKKMTNEEGFVAVATDTYDSLIGLEGVAVSILRPSGKAKIGNERYGIDIGFIDNIVRMQNITRVPKVSRFVKGVINLRGEVIPIISLRLKMGLEEDEISKKTRII